MEKLKIMILVSMMSFICVSPISSAQKNKSLALVAGASGAATILCGLYAFILNAPQRAQRAEMIEKLQFYMKNLDASSEDLAVRAMVRKMINHGISCDRVGLSNATPAQLLPQVALTVAAIISGIACFAACAGMSASSDLKGA